MPSNLYQATNEHRIYDVDGVIMDNPNDFILCRQPDKFKSTGIKLVRDKMSHGFDYEFSDSESPYGFDRAMNIAGQPFNPYVLLLGIYSASGVDGKAIFRFYRNSILQYEANLDFGSFKLIDYSITLTARRINLDDLFRTRFDTPVNFGATTSIDGTSITGITTESMFLHSKNLFLNQFATSSSAREFVLTNSNSGWIVQFDLNQSSTPLQGDLAGYNNHLNSVYGAGALTRLYNSPDLIISPNYVFKDTIGVLEFDITLRYNLLFVNNSLMTGDHLGTFINIDGVETLLAGGLGSFGPQILLDMNIYRVITNQSFAISEGANVSIYDKWDFTGLDSTEWLLRPGFGGVGLDDDRIDAKFTSITEASLSDVYSPFDSFNHILEVINNSTNLLISDFWSNVGDEIFITNGYNIRAFEDREVIIDFKTLFEKWAQPVLGLGFAVINDGGVAKVLMERYDHFYKDVEIDFFSVITDDSFEIEIDKELIFNEIKTGYKDFPKSTDENKNNNIDAFNTEHALLTPITTIKKKATYVSDVIADGYKIENQRREQFKDVPQDTVSDDSKIFCIKGVLSGMYEFFGSIQFTSDSVITIGASYLDIRTGDFVNIIVSGGNPNNGDYTVLEVSTVGASTVLVVSESTSSTNDVTDITITISEVRLRAERDEAFDVLTGVNSPETIYNGGLNPKYMLFNQSLLINSGFSGKPDSAVIKTQEVKLNGEMTCKFKAGEGGYILDPDKETVKMNGDIELSKLNSRNRLFDGLIYNFSTNMSYDRVLAIRDACLSETGLKDYGYISFNDPFGQIRQGFIMSMIYNPVGEKVEFVLRGKYNPEGGTFDYLLDQIIN